MGKFIELTWTTGDKKILVNTDKIAYVANSGEGAQYTRIYFTGITKEGTESIAVRERYEEVKELISKD